MQRADEWGVQQDYVDADGRPQHVGDDIAERVRRVVGRPPDDLAERGPVVTRRGRAYGPEPGRRLEDGATARLDDVVARRPAVRLPLC